MRVANEVSEARGDPAVLRFALDRAMRTGTVPADLQQALANMLGPPQKSEPHSLDEAANSVTRTRGRHAVLGALVRLPQSRAGGEIPRAHPPALLAPRFERPIPGRIFITGIVARSLFGPAKPRRSRLAGNENRLRRTRK